MKKEELPIELLYVRTMIERIPEERRRILEHEIDGRRREQLQTRAIRQLMHAQAWMNFRSVLVFGIVVFLLAAALAQFVGLAKWIRDVEETTIQIPTPFATNTQFSLARFIPESAAVDFAAAFPEYGVGEAALLAAVLVLLLLVWRAYTGYFLLRQAYQLRKSLFDLEKEINVLRFWLEEKNLDREGKKE